MNQSLSIVADTGTVSGQRAVSPITTADILAAFADGDPQTVRAALLGARAAGLDLAAADNRVVLVNLVGHALEWLESEPRVVLTFDAVALLEPAAAMAGFDLLFAALFPDGRVDLARIADTAVVLIARLLAETGRRDEAIGFLATAQGNRNLRHYLPLAHAARCHMLGLDGTISALWTSLSAGADGDPVDPQTWRAIARVRAARADWTGAIDALATGMVLPGTDRVGLGADFAVLAVFLRARGQAHLIAGEQRVRLALAASPAVAAEAAAMLASWSESAVHAVYDIGIREELRTWLHDFSVAPPPAYPMRNGKPHVDTVWLEVTNFCNQKCTFCPDMHREEPREWLPLDRIKAVIDQLHDHVSVGSMQLNAYGEPLLHPQIDQILAYIRDKKLPWPTFFTTHGLTLQGKKLKALSHNYPQGIAVSLHNDSQESYAISRSAKIGDYTTLVARLTDLLTQMVDEAAACHVRLYQMVCNGAEDGNVPPDVRAAFPHSAERMARHVRKWEAIAARIADEAADPARVRALTNTWVAIERSFREANQGDGGHLPVLAWLDANGQEQFAFISPRPVGTYANLLLEYSDDWQVERKLVNQTRCTFIAQPSLAVFATGKLGICCIDLHSTATFGQLDDFEHIGMALTSDAARRIFGELANGVAASKGCQICLASGSQLCGPTGRQTDERLTA